ncbi:MAG: hypothetical protein HC822_18220 [Oscillochloris sp.]|nr:hypothetical protein [Oscillochloris sp.]
MITAPEIVTRARRAYPAFLRSWLAGEPFTPLNFPVGNTPGEYRALQKAVTQLLDRAKYYRVELQTRSTRTYGAQSLPVRVYIDSAADLLRLIDKQAEFAAFQQDVALIRAQVPQLEDWLQANPQRVIEHHGVWPELLAVCSYFLAHPQPDRYARELPIAVHTKFIEEHTGILRRLLDALLPPQAIAGDETPFELRFGLRYDEALVRIRLLDPALGPHLGLPLHDLSAPLSQLAGLPFANLDCVIVENKLVFLTLPALPHSIAIFGGGFRVDQLSKLPWLQTCRLWYWGDLDAQGFQILARLRSHYPQTRSLLMDAPTLAAFQQFVVPGTPCPAGALPGLTSAEQAVFDHLANSTLRLEQERISHTYAREQLQQVVKREL